MSRLRCGIAGALVLVAGTASAAPTKDECIDAHASAQPLRRAGKLREARERLLTCVEESCPAMVRVDCAERLASVERAIPSIAFDARDGLGREVANVAVTLDGAPWIARLDGTAMPVDPGEHTFVFESAGRPSFAYRLRIIEGDKTRREPVTLRDRFEPTPTDAAPVAPREHPVVRVSERRGMPLWAWIAGGAVLALGAIIGGYFLFRGDESPSPRPAGGLGTAPLSLGW